MDTATNLPEFVSEELLCSMLKRAINVCKPRISDLFHYPVNVDLFPSYPSFVVNPMDLSTLETVSNHPFPIFPIIPSDFPLLVGIFVSKKLAKNIL